MYSKTDRSQLLTIACSQEHEKRNKMMAQAEAPKLRLSSSKGKKDESITLKVSFIFFAPLVNLKKVNFDFRANLKRIGHNYTCQLSRLRRDSHACGLKTSTSRRLTLAG